MPKLTLSPRLQTVASFVPQGARLADIGTDHAYLPAWLLLNGVISRAIAADLREGPLARARKTAEEFDLETELEFRLCDGLKGIRPGEADTIVIAGMGGETIAEILGAAPWTREETTLILQPMSGQYELRIWLQKNGYKIKNERIAREGKTLYNIINATGGANLLMTEAELLTGRLDTDEPDRSAYLQGHLNRLRRRIDGMEHASQPEIRSQTERLKRLSREIEQMIEKEECEDANGTGDL